MVITSPASLPDGALGRLPTSKIAAYGAMATPLAMFGYPMAIWLSPFYAGELGISLAAIASMLFLARMTDIVTDPLVGYFSDHSKSRWGRRKPFIAAGTPILLLGIVMLFMPTYLWGEVSGAWYLLLWNAVMFFGVTLITLPYGAWGAELSPDYHERSRIVGIREFFTLSGLILAAAIPFGLAFFFEVTAGLVLAFMAIILVIVTPIAVAICLWRVPENPELGRLNIPLLEGLKLVSRNGPMIRILLIHIIVVAGESFRNALSLFFMRDVVGINMGVVGVLYLIYFSAGLLAVPLWVMLGKKLGKHRAFAVCMAAVSVISILTVFLSRGDFVIFTILFLFKGACFGGLALLPASMLADVIDIDTARSGGKRAGTFFAISGMSGKLATAFGTSLPLLIIGWVGFNPSGKMGVNAPDTLLWLAVNYAIVPAFFFFAALYLVWNYPLTPERHANLRIMIEKRNARLAAKGIAE
jgi:Na+/melibiose symporter-like transporter